MTIVNTNVSSLVAGAALGSQNKKMAESMQNLSTGLRINSAADDAAGMAIASRMESTIRGLTQAVRNSSDGKNMINTVEGASLETVNILQRIRELAVQSANDTNTGLDRSFLQKELTQLVAEVDRISSHTTWNGQKLLDGTFTSKQIQIGMNNSEDVTLSVDSSASGSIGNYEVNTENEVDLHASAGAAVLADNAFTIVGSIGSKSVTATAATAEAQAAITNENTAETGVHATAVTNIKINGLAKAGTHTVAGAYSMSLAGTNTTATAISFTIDVASDMRALRDAVNNVAGTTGITAKMGTTNADVILTHSTGKDIVITAFDGAGTENGSNFHTIAVTALDADEAAQATDAPVGAAVTADGSGASATITTDTDSPLASTRTHGTVKFQSSDAFSIAGFDTSGLSSGTGTGSLAALSSASLSTAANAETAIRIVDGAIHKINTTRADLGAVSNRMDATIDNLTNIITNTQKSQSNIQDADFASETSRLTKSQILAQAATSMLAQANSSKQSVLALLQG
jgi:flagellin